MNLLSHVSLLLRRECDRHMAGALGIGVARPIARGRKRLSVGPSSAGRPRPRGRRRELVAGSALATAESSSLLQSARHGAGREAGSRAPPRPPCRGCGRTRGAPCARTCGRTWRARGRPARSRRSGAAAALGRCAAWLLGCDLLSARARASPRLASALASPRPWPRARPLRGASASRPSRPRLGARPSSSARRSLGASAFAAALRHLARARARPPRPAASAAPPRRRPPRPAPRPPPRRLGVVLLALSVLVGSSALPGGVAAVEARRRELAELVADHRLATRTPARACGRRGRRSCARPSRGRSSSRATRS